MIQFLEREVNTMETSGKRPVLIVDDEGEILSSLRSLLHRDFEVFTAGSGAEGIRILQERPIHIVMTDQRMPEMTGVEFLRQIKDKHPEAIRLIFTGYADIKAIIDAINQGNVFRYVSKPWEPEMLIATLQEAGREYDRIVESEQLLEDLQTYQERCLAFDEDLREKRFGELNDRAIEILGEIVVEGQRLLERVRVSLRAKQRRAR